jgi:hypothetical protein
MLSNEQFLLILAGVIFIWLAILTFFLFRVISHYRSLTKGVLKEDLISILEKILKEEKENQDKIERIFKKIEEIEKEGAFHIQKVGLVRFNPFSNTGGSHSFTLALLNDYDEGVVISSLHSRDQTRIYAKPIKGGKSEKYELSEEEKEAIEKAKKR